jgi:hypothetical protein
MNVKGQFEVINGDRVIGFTSSKKVKELGYADRASLQSWYEEDPTKNYLGMIDLFTNYAEVKIPFMKDLFSSKSVIEVNGMEGTFTYDLPVSRKTGTYTVKDTSVENGETPGIDESYFTVGLSKPYQPGDKLTYDMAYGEQFIVSDQHQVIQEGDVYIHTCQLVTHDKNAYYPKEYLKPGIRYFKTGNTIGEFSEQFSNLESPGETGSITCEFQLGNHRGVETFVTMYANKKSISGATTKSQDVWSQFQEAQEKGLDMMVIGAYDKAKGGIKKNTATICSTLEYLCILENAKMESSELIYQRGGTVRTGNSVKRINEGLWHQARRGKIIQYSRPGGITRDHIRQVSAYVFQGRANQDPTTKILRFKAGWGAYQNIMQIFREEFHSQLAGLSTFMGVDRQIPNPVGGTLKEGLTLAAVKLRSVYIPDIGYIEVEHDPSLDHQLYADRLSKGFVGQGNNQDSYSLVIWDAADPKYSNARTNLPNNTKLIDKGDSKSNVYYVKPEGAHVYWGSSNGRYHKERASDIMSAMRTMSTEFWIHSASAGWMRDITRCIIVELKR